MTKFRFLLAVSTATVALAGGLSAPAVAQETTSAISGLVTSEDGDPIPGARVTVVHTPSGTVSSGVADSSGTFSLRGLRVGGPYTVDVVAPPQYEEQKIEDIYLTVGDTLAVPVQMRLAAIVITASNSGSREVVEGSQSSFNANDIRDIVSARRDVRDIVRRDPLAAYNPNIGGVTIAGGNVRTQRFSVDGVQMQDSFGLNYGGLPSTRGIVSIEAIDQLTVKTAPFDISEGNFQGGAVNVVLKSGTNNVHVSAFGNWGGPRFTGKKTRDNIDPIGGVYPVGNTTVLDFKNWGGSISGPIFEDKLFLSLAYEQLTEGAPNTFGVQGSSAANIVPNLTQAQVDDVISRFGSAGYDDYNIGSVPDALSEKDQKYSAKLDWNVTEGQRVSLSYIHHENTLPNFATGASTGSSSTSSPYIQLQSNMYQLSEFTSAFSGQWNSQWTNAVSSEVRVAYKYYRRGQDAFFGPDYAEFLVCLDPADAGGFYPDQGGTLCSTGQPIIRMGPDTPRQANKFNNKQLTLSSNMQVKLGTHTVKLEADYFRSHIYNLFVYGGSAQASGATPGGSGAYYFDSVANFSNRMANEFTLATTTTGDKNDGYVDWIYSVYTFGAQDTWRPMPSLTINAGVRWDIYASSSPVSFNPNFADRYATLYPGLLNTATLNGRDKVQPRLGFNWSPDRSFRLSGGVGLFAGGLSDVFISNNYSNSGAAINATGATIASIDILRTGGTPTAPTCFEASTKVNLPTALCAVALNNVAGGSVPSAVIDYVKSNAGVAASALTNSLDPNFKLPAQWKYNLSANWRPNFGDSLLASGWSFRADVVYSKAQAAIRWTDLRAQPLVTGGVVQVAPDGRPRYGGLVNGTAPGGNYDIQLTNTTQGRAWIFSVGATKGLGAFDLSAYYTHQNVKDVAGVLTSSTVSSSYSIPTSDPNSGGDYGRSAFEVTHTIRANFDFHHNFFGDNETRFGINWELRSGQPYSVTMFDSTSNSATGRASVFGTALNTSSHLLYVPNFDGGSTTTTLVASNGVSYNAPQVGNVIFGSSLTGAGTTAAQHAASATDAFNNLNKLVMGTDLKNYQGKIAPKNLLSGPWYNKVDISVAQQIPFVFHSKLTAILGIENFLNLLNRDWGSYLDYGVSQTAVRVACSGTSGGQTCANYVYSNYSVPKTQAYSKPSLYAIRFGVRYDF